MNSEKSKYTKRGEKMLPENLQELIKQIIQRQSEAQTIEVKSAHQGCPKRLYDTLSSFSNQDEGGILVFGLDETQNFAPVGVYDLQDLQKKVTEQCQQMEPVVRAVFTIAEMDGKQFLSAEIPGIDYSERPCFYKGAGKLNGSFIRTGDADLPMTDYELYNYETFRKHIRNDERIVERASIDALDSDLLQRYVDQKKMDHPKFAQLPQEMILSMLNIVQQGHPTIAALMNFGLYPQSFFPQFAITAIAVMGNEIGDTDPSGARFMDNERMEGNLDAMLEGAISFCRRNMKVHTVIDPLTGKRKDRMEYPITAVREAILNALIHRDYSHYTEGTPIQIDFFSNRLEIHSPGGLYGRMTVEDLGKVRLDLRNPTLAVMAEVMTQSENRYSGIPTMRKAMKEANLPAPLFENRKGEFIVTFFNGQVPDEKIESIDSYPNWQMGLLQFCKEPRTKKEIADFLGMKTLYYVMSRYVKPLVKDGKLKVIAGEGGNQKGKKYYCP